MDSIASLVFDSSIRLYNNAPERHAQIRQRLYEQLALPFEKQLTLYTHVLGPVSSGKLECPELIKKTVNSVIQEL